MTPERVRNITVFGHKNGWGEKISGISKGIFEKVIGIDKDVNEQEVAEALRASQLAFLAAPDTEIKGIIETHRTRLLDMQILDCATNKGPFKKDLLKLAEKTSVTSTHPMVISSSATRGQNVIIMPINENSAPSQKNAIRIYRKLEMEPKTLSFEKHGDRMAIIQQVPHLIQRIGLHLLRNEIQRRGLSYEEIADIAPANAQITELALGRVGMQRPDVSAGIIHQAFQEDGGRDTMKELLAEVGRLITACEGSDRQALTDMFQEEIGIFDPTGKWRKRVKLATDIELEAMGNFKKKSFSLLSHNNKPGLLHKITGILLEQGINITAIHSHESEDKKGSFVRFDIGIDKEGTDWNILKSNLEALELEFIE